MGVFGEHMADKWARELKEYVSPKLPIHYYTKEELQPVVDNIIKYKDNLVIENLKKIARGQGTQRIIERIKQDNQRGKI